jgi:hypothetical protein
MKCWPWSHKWTKWEPREMNAIQHPVFRNGPSVEVTMFWQERRCERCGRIEQEKLRGQAVGSKSEVP